MVQQVADAKETNNPEPKQPVNTAGVIVLQWLSYAFWGWLALGLIWLMSVILINGIVGESVNEIVPYAIAASVVLLPIAFVTDLFYRKNEPLKKTGAAMIIMVIHTVLFALLAIGALVITVFTAINLTINLPTSPNGQVVAVFTSLFATIIYVAIFLRILNPIKSKKPSFIFGISMLAITVLLLVFAVVGPVVKSISTRQDRLIEQNLSSIQTGIREYVRTNNNLPKSLSDIELKQGGKELVDKNLVEYIPNSTQKNYQLCVTYTASKGQRGEYSNSTNTYISTYSHPSGRVCYTLVSNIRSNGLNNQSYQQDTYDYN